jgi:hypothetical protein
VQIGIALSVGAALFDYAENLGVSIMILKWPNLPHMLVQASSLATISKSCLTVAALVMVLILGAIRLHQRSQSRKVVSS